MDNVTMLFTNMKITMPMSFFVIQKIDRISHFKPKKCFNGFTI
jgi:hypothetical protein